MLIYKCVICGEEIKNPTYFTCGAESCKRKYKAFFRVYRNNYKLTKIIKRKEDE